MKKLAVVAFGGNALLRAGQTGTIDEQETNTFDAARYSLLSDGNHFISFDRVTHVMKRTGKDLPSLYRETSQGGLSSDS